MNYAKRSTCSMCWGLLAATLLAGCATSKSEDCDDTAIPVNTSSVESSVICCIDPEPYPDWIGRTGLALSSTLGRVAAVIVFRDGYLERFPEASAYLTERLQPLDFIAIESNGHLSHALVPGKFGHVAIYLGTERELRDFGLWDHPNVVVHHEKIGEGRLVLEADRNGVHLASFKSLLDADTIALLRPNMTVERQRSVLWGLVDQLGTPFDFLFDADDDSNLFCAELIANAIPELSLPKREAYGRKTILPDEIAYRAATDLGTMTVAAYITATRRKWEVGTSEALLRSLNETWAK